jgi:hypothetical protein
MKNEVSQSQSHNKEARTMSQQHFGRAYGGSAPENYERYFVPVIGAPLAADLIDTAALRPSEQKRLRLPTPEIHTVPLHSRSDGGHAMTVLTVTRSGEEGL